MGDANVKKAGDNAGRQAAQQAIVQPTEQALEAMFSQPTPREVYRTQARHAAALERARQYRQAQRYWLEAGMNASNAHDRHWCESRAALCGRQETENGRQASPTNRLE